MEISVSQDAISTILANPSPESGSDLPEIVVQVVDLKPTGNRYMFTASDGKMKLKAILQSSMSSEVISGAIQNLGLVRILDYTLNDIPMKNEKYLIVTKCEAVSPPLEAEYKAEAKSEGAGIILKPKQEIDVKSVKESETAGITLKPKEETVAKSAAQIVHEQNGKYCDIAQILRVNIVLMDFSMAPTARMAMTRRIHPLVSLNPYQGNWTIKVCVTSKGNMRSYKNARGEGCVFNVELTDQDGTQIQATMFNEAAKKFYDKFELGKMYYISKGTLRVANKQFKTVQNDYEMTLNENSQVEEASNEAAFIPETKFNFVPIDELGPYVNGRELVDIIGVVQSVSPTMSIRRKSNNEMIPKRDITIADETKKTVVVSLWNDLATSVGQELLDMADKSPVVAIKSVKVGDFQGVSLSALSKSTVLVNPDVPKAKDLRAWFDTEGKETSLASVGSGLSPSSKNGSWSIQTERVSLLHITSNPSLGEGKPVFFRIKAQISFIKPDQAMWYRGCKTCNKKVTEAIGSGYWCEGCQKNDEECRLRYIMVMRVSDASGEAWLSVFNEQAEKIIGCSADELDRVKSQDGESVFQEKLKEATWTPYLFQVSVAVQEYNNEKRQRITVRGVAPVDYVAESKYLVEEMAKINIIASA
nr:replication protein A 70 kDa DNA-binding subunit B [Ipomoea batatas]